MSGEPVGASPAGKTPIVHLKGMGAMRKFSQALVNFIKREDGPTAVEYAVMLALIIVVCLAAITTLGQNANTTFTTVGQKIGSASS